MGFATGRLFGQRGQGRQRRGNDQKEKNSHPVF
jgi:hypothetical protein